MSFLKYKIELFSKFAMDDLPMNSPDWVKRHKLLSNYNKSTDVLKEIPIESFRKTTDDHTIVFSTNPVDILNMSTRSEWTSCTNLFSGAHKEQAVYNALHKYCGIIYITDNSNVEMGEKMLYRSLVFVLFNTDPYIYVAPTYPKHTTSNKVRDLFVNILQQHTSLKVNQDYHGFLYSETNADQVMFDEAVSHKTEHHINIPELKNQDFKKLSDNIANELLRLRHDTVKITLPGNYNKLKELFYSNPIEYQGFVIALSEKELINLSQDKSFIAKADTGVIYYIVKSIANHQDILANFINISSDIANAVGQHCKTAELALALLQSRFYLNSDTIHNIIQYLHYEDLLANVNNPKLTINNSVIMGLMIDRLKQKDYIYLLNNKFIPLNSIPKIIKSLNNKDFKLFLSNSFFTSKFGLVDVVEALEDKLISLTVDTLEELKNHVNNEELIVKIDGVIRQKQNSNRDVLNYIKSIPFGSEKLNELLYNPNQKIRLSILHKLNKEQLLKAIHDPDPMVVELANKYLSKLNK